MEQETNSGGGYGKKPLWQWVLLYVVIGGIVYALIYYFVLGGNSGGYNYNTNTSTAPTESGQSTQTTTTTTIVTPAPTNPAPSNVKVSIKNFSFSPQTLTVKTGTKVTWTNNDSVPHTVTSDSDNLLNSGTISPGQSFSFTFTNTGSANYHCSIHPMMKGVVVVQN